MKRELHHKGLFGWCGVVKIVFFPNHSFKSVWLINTLS